MLKRRWTIPTWRNIEEKSRHHSPLTVFGPKLAPQRRRLSALGLITLTWPKKTIAAKTATLAARITGVQYTRGVCSWRMRRNVAASSAGRARTSVGAGDAVSVTASARLTVPADAPLGRLD